MSQKNAVEQAVKELNDHCLGSALDEAEHWRKTGTLQPGWIMQVSSESLAEEYQLPIATVQSMVVQEVYRQAALKWESVTDTSAPSRFS
jgi:hypothetical protein